MPGIDRSSVPQRSALQLGVLALLLSLLAGVTGLLSACGPATAEPIDAAHLAGRWELTTDGETEWFHLADDGTFRCEIRRDGFLSTTLPDESAVTLQGTWTLEQQTLTFQFEAAPNVSGPHVYRIVSLTDRDMQTESPDGSTHTLIKSL